MRSCRLLFLGLWLALWGGAAAAQDGVSSDGTVADPGVPEGAWVQVEARPTLGEAEARASAYASAFGDVAGFRVASGWYAIALGPYSAEEAARRLSDLRRENLIPADSFVANGTEFRAPFFPAGADPAATPPQDARNAAAPFAVGPGPGLTAPAEDASLAPILPDETDAEARASEAALDRERKRDIQAALKAFGFYDAALDGAIGPGTRDAMAAWQDANGYFPSGILTTAQRAALLGERDRVAAELGLQTVTDSEAGIEITLPMALVQFQDYQPPFVHYAERDGSGLRAVLISEPGSAASLAELYDRLQTLEAMPRTGPRRLGGDSFTIEGANAKAAAFAFARQENGAVKGFMLTWDPARPDKAARALDAMRRSFRASGSRALDPGLVAMSDAQRSGLMAGMAVRRPALTRSGFFVGAQGAVLTTADAVAGCARITLDRDQEASVAFADAGLGVALLTPATPLAPRAVARLAGIARPGEAVTVAGYSYGEALPSAALTPGRVEDVTGLDGNAGVDRLTAAVLPGDAGGPVLDASGAVLGMLLAPKAEGGRVLPKGVAFAVDAAALSARMAQAGVSAATPEPATPEPATPEPVSAPASAPLSPDAIAARGADLTVLVSCWK